MTKKELSFEPIRLMEIDLYGRKNAWLSAHGWKYTSDFPDSCWRWVKKIKGKSMMCSRDEALNIELNCLP
jgi:hypothetical protein